MVGQLSQALTRHKHGRSKVCQALTRHTPKYCVQLGWRRCAMMDTSCSVQGHSAPSRREVA